MLRGPLDRGRKEASVDSFARRVKPSLKIVDELVHSPADDVVDRRELEVGAEPPQLLLGVVAERPGGSPRDGVQRPLGAGNAVAERARKVAVQQ